MFAPDSTDDHYKFKKILFYNFFLIIQKNFIKVYLLTPMKLNQDCSERNNFSVRNGFEKNRSLANSTLLTGGHGSRK